MRVKVRRGKWQPPVTADKPKRVGRKRRKYPMFSELPIGAAFFIGDRQGRYYDQCTKTDKDTFGAMDSRTGEMYMRAVDLSDPSNDFSVITWSKEKQNRLDSWTGYAVKYRRQAMGEEDEFDEPDDIEEL